MPYIFRKYSGADENGTKGWSPNKPIDADSFVNENIVITKGTSKTGTSIPSPLARLELFETAFKIVSSDKSSLKGNSVYHQLVSECLDVLQLLFNAKNEDVGSDKKLWFKEWKVRDNIDKLKAKGELHPHSLLAKSLQQIFFDKNDSGFSSVDSIFLIYYEKKLLGGTSPLTLVFTSPNWSRYIREGDIRNVPQSADGDVFFDDEYRALYERDEEFIRYLYKLLLHNPEAFSKAKSFRSYINKTIQLKFSSWMADASAAKTDGNVMSTEYSELITNIENKYLTVNGMFFYHQKEGKEQEKVQSVSDFLIRASVTKYSTQTDEDGVEHFVNPPLVLVDGMNYSGDYMEKNVPWNSSTRVRDVYLLDPLYKRKLPQGASQSVRYPFISVDDFLENNIIEIPFNLNRNKFVSCAKGDFKYLLPIKKEYFNFFTLSDLKTNLSITIDEGGEVKVKLKVPVRNKKGVPDILFSKSYTKQKGIVECRADVGIYPFYQVTDNDVLNDYTVLLANAIERDRNKEELALRFFSFKQFASDDKRLESKMTVRSVFDIPSTATSKYYKIKTAFDYIQLRYQSQVLGDVNGIIIPDFTNRTYNKGTLIKHFTFAIDFGTSNTHVAWMDKDEALPKPFEIEPADQQMVLLNEPSNTNDLEMKYGASYGRFPEVDLIIRREYLPPFITTKDNAPVAFPFKTATCEIIEFNNIETSQRDLFSHINIGYYIDKEENRGNVAYTTNLKWLLENSTDNSNRSRVKLFLQQLMWQIKAKAILNNGDLARLQIVWSVPLSMGVGNKTTLKAVLRDAFEAVFAGTGAALQEPIPESVAPYFYLTQSDSGIQNIANVVNIDIGGGTTDVMMFMESAGADRSDKYLTTSFRFAGNDLWGSGYKGKLKDNGFIKNYISYQRENSNITPYELKYFLNGKEDSNLSADDLISLLFKYDSKVQFSNSVTIGNPNLSLVLYLHFSAIIYHIIQIIEARNYPMPRYISFTGKGSQYVKLLCGGDESELEEFVKRLIKVYTDLPIQSSFKIHLNKNPKEITANGSVLYSLAEDDNKRKYNDAPEFVHPGFDPMINKDLGEKLSGPTPEKFLNNDILQVNSVLNVSVLNNINTFLEKTLTSRSIIDYLNDFKVKNLSSAYNLLRWNGNIDNGEGLVYDSYRKVLNNIKYEEKDRPIAESLFFFGFKDALYQLSKYITDTKN